MIAPFDMKEQNYVLPVEMRQCITCFVNHPEAKYAFASLMVVRKNLDEMTNTYTEIKDLYGMRH